MSFRSLLIVLCTLVSIRPSLADYDFNTYLHDQKTVERLSRGARTHRGTYLWPGQINLGIFTSDERKAGAFRGYLTGVTRMLNIELMAKGPINFVVLTDRSALSAFPFEKFRGTFVAGPNFEEWVARIKGMTDCQTILSVDEVGAIHFVILSNYYEYATSEFINCLETSNLRALGASIDVHALHERPKFKIEEIYRFLSESYAKGDRKEPFASRFGK